MCVIIGILSFLVVSESFLFVRMKRENDSLTAQIRKGERTVYVATEKIPKGSSISDENVEKTIGYSEASQACFITEEAFGKTVSADVAEGMYLTESMIVSPGADTRNVYISDAEIPENVADGSRIDVRIRYPNAEDYTVLADKIINKGTSGNGMVLALTEEEILILSSAVADKVSYSGVRLYVVGYPEYEQTDSATVNYPARQDILILLNKEQAEGENRRALEKRLLQNQR